MNFDVTTGDIEIQRQDHYHLIYRRGKIRMAEGEGGDNAPGAGWQTKRNYAPRLPAPARRCRLNFDEAQRLRAKHERITYPRLVPQRLVMGLAAREGPLVKSFVSEQEVFLQRSDLRTKGTRVFVTPPLSWDEQNI